MTITLDLGRAWWRVRRWYWQSFAWGWNRGNTGCVGCGVQLTDDERTYYGSQCERCEGDDHAKNT